MKLTAGERVMAEGGLIALCGCLAALFDPFNQPDMPLGARLAYWIIGFLIAWGFVRLLAIVGGAVAKLLGLAPQWGYALTIPLATVGITWGVLYWTGGSEMALGDAFGPVWVTALLIGIGFFALFFALYARVDFRAEGEEARETSAELEPEQTQLHERLPAGFPAIIALSVEDHYTRVHAAWRSEMVLMPLSEAITLVPETNGQQVHRSWWAAREAVVSHKREGRDIKLVLENELEVPVSRANVKTLREAGWLS